MLSFLKLLTDKARFMHRFKVKILCIWDTNVRYVSSGA